MTTTPTGPQIQAMMLNKAPKYGNDDDTADRWTVAVENYIGKTLRHEYKSSKYGKGPVPCCFSYSQSPVSGNVAFGRQHLRHPGGPQKRRSGQQRCFPGQWQRAQRRNGCDDVCLQAAHPVDSEGRDL